MRLTLAGLLMSASLTLPAAAQTAEEFYCDVGEMRMVVSSSAGGGYDTFGRLVAQYMSRHLPCTPNFVIENMPGGGGVRAGNYMYDSAPRDGSTIAIIDRGIMTAPLLYGESTETTFNAREFNLLGSLVKEIGVGMVRSESAVQSIEDAKSTKAFFGASGVETDSAMYARLVNSLFDAQIETITGYAGQSEYYLAMEQGETDGLFMSGFSGPNRLQALQARERGEVKFFVQFAREPDAEIGADVPTIYELLENEEDGQIIDLLLSRLTLGRPFIAPPGVPADRLAMLRDAFAKTVSDPDLLAEAERLNFRISPVLGEEAQAQLAGVYETPAPILDRVRSIVAVPQQ